MIGIQHDPVYTIPHIIPRALAHKLMQDDDYYQQSFGWLKGWRHDGSLRSLACHTLRHNSYNSNMTAVWGPNNYQYSFEVYLGYLVSDTVAFLRTRTHNVGNSSGRYSALQQESMNNVPYAKG